MLGHAFGTLGIARLRLLVAAHNRRAIACYTRCGFVPVVRCRDRRRATFAMICPNPALPQSTPLRRTLQLPGTAPGDGRLRLSRADCAFLGVRLGEPVALDVAAGELLITTPAAADAAADGDSLTVALSEEEHDRLALIAAHLGLSPAALIVELVGSSRPSPRTGLTALRTA